MAEGKPARREDAMLDFISDLLFEIDHLEHEAKTYCRLLGAWRQADPRQGPMIDHILTEAGAIDEEP